MPSSNVRRIDPGHPARNAIADAARVIATGGIVAFPTRNLYGLGADAFDPEAVTKIFRIKQRPPEKPILVLIRDRSGLDGLVRRIPAAAVAVMDAFWPGGVTIIFEARPEVPDILTAHSGKIGIRLPAHPVAAALTRAVRHPITGTSANISGKGGCADIALLAPAVTDGVDLILDAGPLPEGIGSTIVDVTAEPFRILREGTVSAERLYRAVGSAR